MPQDLILNSLDIQRYRCFRELRIKHLGRVNLIVGKNNVGKSTILEALRLFANPASFRDIVEILRARDEIADLDSRDGEYEVDDLPFQRFFFGRGTFRIGSDLDRIYRFARKNSIDLDLFQIRPGAKYR